jgi:RNA polymerase sigma-70 factor (ECF subfamily)
MRELVERYQGAVFGLCYRMLGQREDAEDIAQDAFLRAFRSLKGWDAARPLKPWLLTIAANRCRTFLEKRGRYPVSASAAVESAAETDPDPATDLAEELQAAIEKLREDYRACFILFHQQELSCAQIGEILGCPEGTVKTWLHRARKELAEHLQRRGVTPHAEHPLH